MGTYWYWVRQSPAKLMRIIEKRFQNLGLGYHVSRSGTGLDRGKHDDADDNMDVFTNNYTDFECKTMRTGPGDGLFVLTSTR